MTKLFNKIIQVIEIRREQEFITLKNSIHNHKK